MALHTHNVGRPQGLPLEAVLASIPSYPRPVIERLVSRLIDTLDEQDAPTMDLEVAWPEQGLWRLHDRILNEDDEEDDHSGGNVEDEGERDEGCLVPLYGIDQTQTPRESY